MDMEEFVRKGHAADERMRQMLSRFENRTWVRAVLFFALLALMTISIYLLNANMPLILDDYDFMYSWATGEMIDGFADVIRSQMVHYQIWGGRMLHVFTQLFLYLGKEVFNIANTAMFMLLLLEIYAIARPRERRFCWTLLLLAYLVLTTALPFFGTVFLWLTGACVYLFGTVLVLLPLLIVRSVQESGFFARGYLRAALCLPLGILAGWTNENTTCGMIAVIFMLLAGDYLKKKRVSPRLILLFAGQCIGALLLLLAPGNALRASGYTYDSMLFELIRRFVSVTAYGMCYLGLLLACVILLSAGLGREHASRTHYAYALVFAAVISVYAMVGSPELSDRTYTGAFVLMLAALLVLVGDAEVCVRRLDAAKIAVLPLVCVFMIYTGYHALKDVRHYAAQWHASVETIESARLAGETQVSLVPIPSASRFTMDIELSKDPLQWPNSTLSKYYGINIIGQ